MKSNGLYKFNIFLIIYYIFFAQIVQLIFGVEHIPFANYMIVPFLSINIIYNKKWRQLAITGPMLIWLILCIYADINSLIQGHKPWYLNYKILTNTNISLLAFSAKIFAPYLVMVSSCWCYKYNPKTFLRILTLTYAIYAVIVFGFDTARSIDTTRFSNVVGNSGSLRMMGAIFLCILAYTYKYISLRRFLGIVFIALLLILSIQTRKALIGACVMLLFGYLSKMKIYKASTWIMIIFGTIVFFSGTELVLNNTAIGKRFSEVKEQGDRWNNSHIEGLSILGDRAAHYYFGYLVWEKHKIFGVGYDNASHYTKLPQQLHTEYWVQLVENGVIGFSLYLLFLFSLVKPLIIQIKADSNNYTLSLICLGTMLSFMFVSLTTWTWSSENFYMVYGVIAAQGLNLRRKEHNFLLTT